MLLRNVGLLSTDYMALYPRRYRRTIKGDTISGCLNVNTFLSIWINIIFCRRFLNIKFISHLYSRFDWPCLQNADRLPPWINEDVQTKKDQKRRRSSKWILRPEWASKGLKLFGVSLWTLSFKQFDLKNLDAGVYQTYSRPTAHFML
jgi:hypothetical protein